jgi:hypothetical protein
MISLDVRGVGMLPDGGGAGAQVRLGDDKRRNGEVDVSNRQVGIARDRQTACRIG